MNHVDESIMVALRDRADGGVLVEDLLAGARQRGQRRRTVRRTLTGAGAGVAALAVIGAVAVVLPLGGKTTVTPRPDVAGAPVPSPPGRPPIATGAPLLGQGGSPGKDGVFHIDHDGPATATTSWRAGPGWELMQSGGAYTVAIGDSPTSFNRALVETGMELTADPITTQLTVDGKPASFVWSGMNPADGARWGYLRWQPVAGTWALVFSSFAADPGTDGDTDKAKLLELTEGVRFDRVYRCAVDFRITWMPPAAEISSCEFSGGREPSARVQLSAGEATVSVTVGPRAGTAAKPVKTNTDFAGTPLEYTDAGRVRRVAGDRVITVDPGTAKLDREDALHLTAGVTPITAPDPADWPADPLR